MPKKLLTPEVARLLAEKSHAAKKRNSAVRSLLANQQTQPQTPVDEYPLQQLLITRDHVKRLNYLMQSMLDKEEPDYAEMDKLGRVLTGMYELERVLSGRPLPGTNKPGQSKARPASAIVAPTLGIAPIEAPAPIQPAPPTPATPDQAIDPAI